MTDPDKIPEDFVWFLEGIASDIRLRVVLVLLDNHEKPGIPLSELQKKIAVNQDTLLEHLNKLEVGGAVQNFLQKREGTDEQSFYEITEFGKYMIERVIKAYNDFYKWIKPINLEVG